MNQILENLANYNSVGLKEIDSVKLMNRVDTKFVFAKTKLLGVLQELMKDYYVLEINNKRVSGYKTMYYDSEDFICYYMHQHGRVNRYKFRTREYLETGKFFFELKIKNNHKKTYKSRVSRKDGKFSISQEHIDFVTKKIDKSIDDFNGVLWVDYDRISLVSKKFTERLTIDLNLTFSNDSDTKSFDNLVILELKQDKSAASLVREVLHSKKIFQISLSKYCLGIASLYPVKTNNINEKIRLINKLSYESVE
jgi:hypothetical protein